MVRDDEARQRNKLKLGLVAVNLDVAATAAVFPDGAPNGTPMETKGAPHIMGRRQPSQWWWPFEFTSRPARQRGAASPVVAPPAPKRKPLPPTKPPVMKKKLDADDIAGLHPSVIEQRDKLLKAEKSMHEGLSGIERTRHKYLTPSNETRCSVETDRVARCYTHYNASRRRKGGAASGNDLMASSVLNCASYVDELEQCAQRVGAEHVRMLPDEQ
jgi:hypothetical protein